MTSAQAWTLNHCLSSTAGAEVVMFDAADVFGGILQEGAYVTVHA